MVLMFILTGGEFVEILVGVPVVARSSRELDARIKAKWARDLPQGV